MLDKVKEEVCCFTETGKHELNNMLENGLVPFMVVSSNKYVRKLFNVVAEEIKQVEISGDIKIKRRSINDKQDDKNVTVYLVNQQALSFVLRHFHSDEVAEKLNQFNVPSNPYNVTIENGGGEILKEDFFYQIIVGYIKKTKQAKREKIKKIVTLASGEKFEMEKFEPHVVVDLKPLSDDATEQEKMDWKKEYNRLLKIAKQEAEEEYIKSLPDDKREAYKMFLIEEEMQSLQLEKEAKEQKEARRAELFELLSDEQKEKFFNDQKEVKRAKNKRQYANRKAKLEQLPEEERNEYRIKQNAKTLECRHRRLARMTEEELAEYRSKFNERRRLRIESMSEEERLEYKRRATERAEKSRLRQIENMTEEEYEAYREKKREYSRNHYARKKARMTEAELDAAKEKNNAYARKYYREKLDAMTEEEYKEFRAKESARNKDYLKRKREKLEKEKQDKVM